MEVWIIPSLHFARMTSQEQGFHDFAAFAVPLNTSPQDASHFQSPKFQTKRAGQSVNKRNFHARYGHCI